MISMLGVSARGPRLREKRPPLCPGFCGWDWGGVLAGGGSWHWGRRKQRGRGGEPCCGRHGNHRAAEVGAVTLGRGCPAGWALSPGRKPWPPCPLPPARGCGDLGWPSAHAQGLPGSVPAALCAAHTPPALTAILPQPRASPRCGGKEPRPGHTTGAGARAAALGRSRGVRGVTRQGGFTLQPRAVPAPASQAHGGDRKSTRLNSSH